MELQDSDDVHAVCYLLTMGYIGPLPGRQEDAPAHYQDPTGADGYQYEQGSESREGIGDHPDELAEEGGEDPRLHADDRGPPWLGDRSRGIGPKDDRCDRPPDQELEEGLDPGGYRSRVAEFAERNEQRDGDGIDESHSTHRSRENQAPAEQHPGHTDRMGGQGYCPPGLRPTTV